MVVSRKIIGTFSMAATRQCLVAGSIANRVAAIAVVCELGKLTTKSATSARVNARAIIASLIMQMTKDTAQRLCTKIVPKIVPPINQVSGLFCFS